MDLVPLVTQARSGDLDAYEELVRRFQDMAVGYAFAVIGDFHLGEDAAQEAFVQAYRKIGSLREPAAFPGWLRQIVYRQCDRITRRRRLISVPLDAELASPEPAPDTILENREVAGEVRALLDVLPDAERQAATMHYIGGQSQREIGAFLGVSVDTVKNRLRAARGRMKREMIDMVERNLSKRRPSKDESFAERVIKGLVGYTDREIQIILYHANWHDVAILLGDMDDGVRKRVLSNMSMKASQMLIDEMTLIGRVSKKRMNEVRKQVVDVIRQQGEAGSIAWPVEKADRSASGRRKKLAPNVQALRRRLPDVAGKSRLRSMRLEEVSDFVVDLAESARHLGILSLQKSAQTAVDPFVRQAIRLVTDGYEPQRARSLLEDMMTSTLRHEETVCRMVATWTRSIGEEEPPAVLEQHLRALYRPGVPERETHTKATVGSVKRALKGRHLAELTLDEVVDVLMEGGILARLRGVKALMGLLGEANHALLAHALPLLYVRKAEGDVLEMILTDHQDALMARLEVAHRMFMEGMLIIQMGWNPVIIESRVRAIGGI